MLHNEFEKLTGIQVTDEEFNEINAMYMNAGDIDKKIFVEDWMKHQSSAILHKLNDTCNFRQRAINMYMNDIKGLKEELETASNMMADAMANNTKKTNSLKMEMAEFLLKQADIYENKEFARKAIELVGMRMLIKIKLENGYKLFQKDKDYILETMGVLDMVKDYMENVEDIENEEQEAE